MKRPSTFSTALLLLITLTFAAGSGEGKQIGTTLVYQVEPEGGASKVDPEMMWKVLAVVDARVNPHRFSPNALAQQAGADRIEIGIYGNDKENVERIKNIIDRSGTLAFRILANVRDHMALIEKAKLLGDDPKQIAVMDKDEEGKEYKAAWFVPMKIGDRPEDKKRISGVLSYPEIYTRKVKESGEEVIQVLVVGDKFNVNGKFPTNTSAGIDQNGKRCVNFLFDAKGAQLFAALTSSNLPEQSGKFTRKLGIVLDGYLNSAPSIRSTISNQGEITGEFTEAEIKDLVDVLNAGSLPAKLRLVDTRTTDQ